MLCRELWDIEPRPELPEWCGDGFDILQTMGVYDIADVVTAALAAADCARAAEELCDLCGACEANEGKG